MASFTIPDTTDSSGPAPTQAPLPTTTDFKKRPTVILVVGMAGSGKTTFLTRLYRHLTTESARPLTVSQRVPAPEGEGPCGGYYMNLDPACTAMPFTPSIDIRTTISYKDVMSSYNLGPNGAIMTSLNLFATKFDQVINILEKRAEAEPALEYIIIDTPGQIESFTWSASGQIITESLATSFPTVLTFVADTPRCSDPSTFMSTMLYACSVMYRSNIPLCVAFNKTDVTPHDTIAGWMTDFESFQEAMEAKEARNDGGGYYESLTRSMALTLDEFYSELKTCGVSAATGDGVSEFFDKIDDCRQEYFDEFAKDLEVKREEAVKRKEEENKESEKKLIADLKKTGLA